MITAREIEIIERAIKVSAYSDDDALLILKGLLIEKNEEIARVYEYIESKELRYEEIDKEEVYTPAEIIAMSQNRPALFSLSMDNKILFF